MVGVPRRRYKTRVVEPSIPYEGLNVVSVFNGIVLVPLKRYHPASVWSMPASLRGVKVYPKPPPKILRKKEKRVKKVVKKETVDVRQELKRAAAKFKAEGQELAARENRLRHKTFSHPVGKTIPFALVDTTEKYCHGDFYRSTVKECSAEVVAKKQVKKHAKKSHMTWRAWNRRMSSFAKKREQISKVCQYVVDKIEDVAEEVQVHCRKRFLAVNPTYLMFLTLLFTGTVVRAEFGGFQTEDNFHAFKDGVKSVCYHVGREHLELFGLTLASHMGDSCLSDVGDCKLQYIPDSQISADGWRMDEKSFYPWSDVCGSYQKAGHIYYMTKNVGVFMYNVTGPRVDSGVREIYKTSELVNGHTFSSTVGIVGGLALPLETRIVYKGAPSATKRATSKNRPGPAAFVYDGKARGDWVCAVARQYPYTNGHIIALCNGGPDHKMNCHHETSQINSVKSMYMESAMNKEELREFGFKVNRIEVVGGVPIAQEFTQWYRTESQICIYWFDQSVKDVEDSYRTKCSTLKYNTFTWSYIFADVYEGVFGPVVRFTSYLIDRFMPGKATDVWQYLRHNILGWCTSALTSINSYGWMMFEVVKVYTSYYLYRPVAYADRMVMDYKVMLPQQYEPAMIKMKEAFAANLHGKDVVLIIKVQTQEAVGPVMTSMFKMLEKYMKNVRNQNSLVVGGEDHRAVNVFGTPITKGELKNVFSAHKIISDDYDAFNVFVMVEPVCDGESTCDVDYYRYIQKGMVACSEKDGCYVIAVSHQKDPKELILPIGNSAQPQNSLN